MDRLALAAESDIPMNMFQSTTLCEVVDTHCRAHDFPPVLASLKVKRTCRAVNDGFATTFAAPPLHTGHAIVYAGDDLLIASMVEMPGELEPELPPIKAAPYTIPEGKSVRLVDNISIRHIK